MLVMSFKGFLGNLDWQEDEDSVSDHSAFVIGVSSNGIIRMKKQRSGNASNTINMPFKVHKSQYNRNGLTPHF